MILVRLSKKNDVLCVPPELTAKMTVRVAVLEILCSGAEVISVSNVVAGEMEPTGKRVIAGIKEELRLAHLTHIPLNGSTEDNMVTSQTSVGVFVTGIAHEQQLKVNNISRSATLFAIGEPLVGKEVLAHPNLSATYELVRHLVKREEVLELVPVGSKGIVYEAKQLAHFNECQFALDEDFPTAWSNKSAGPATVLLMAVENSQAEAFRQKFSDAYIVGQLY